ncbi:hypothetical protein ACSDR0_24860 [Streptosporangium sp. G11]|uniref:hypothetical protein n=1 Tax=Streptosporangium sp. G11 TaxID=3436926 RepID=UPI003EBACE1F
MGGSSVGCGAVRLAVGTLPSMLGQGPSTGSPPPGGHGFAGEVIGPAVGRFRDGCGLGVSWGPVGARVSGVSVGSGEAGASEITVTVFTGGSAPPPQPVSMSRPATVKAGRRTRAATLLPYCSVMVGGLPGTEVTRLPQVHPPAEADRYPPGL